MAEFFQWLTGNSIATSILFFSFGLVVILITLLYLFAFIQGREITFWPPKIGTKPSSKTTPADVKKVEPTIAPPKSLESPVIQSGVIVTGISGKAYNIKSSFYSGATSNLFLATNNDSQVIVKVFWRGLKPHSEQWEFFSRQQRSLEVLSHRSIVKVFDRGLYGGYPFLVMEYFKGGTLRDLLQSKDRIPGNEILSIANQVAGAIDFAHSHGIIHRDIKPGNILFETTPHDRVALSDFGIAKILGAVERDITAEPGFTGSPAYLAPETLNNEEITKASDIYSFGIVLFEMISGRVPFDDFHDVYSMLQAKIFKDAPSIKAYRPVSNQLSNRISQTLNRNPKERPSSARDVLSGIEKYILNL